MSSKANRRKILVALGGKNPQIITEGLFCLVVKNKINIEKLIILTTKECKELFTSGLKEEIAKMSELYRFDPPELTESDILYVDDEYSSNGKNELFATMVFDIIQKLTSQEDLELHCLISGGRKTMSVDLATALTLFARAKDRMYHILTDKEFEKTGLYFPQDFEQSKSLVLIEKPFIRLRHIVSDIISNLKEINYTALLTRLQEELDNSFDIKPLIIDVENRKLVIGNKAIYLQPFPFAVYYFFARQKYFIKGGKNFSKTNSEKLWRIYKRFSTSNGQLERVRKFAFNNGEFDFEVILKAISQIRRQFKHTLRSNPFVELYTISVEGTYSNKRYGIKLPKEKIRLVRKNLEKEFE